MQIQTERRAQLVGRSVRSPLCITLCTRNSAQLRSDPDAVCEKFAGKHDPSVTDIRLQRSVLGHILLFPVYKHVALADVAKRLFERIALNDGAPDGIYPATSGSQTVPLLIFEMGLDTRIVTSNVFAELISDLAHKNTVCSIFRDPERQGRLAVRAIYEYLAEHTRPAERILVPPTIVIEANVGQFLDG